MPLDGEEEQDSEINVSQNDPKYDDVGDGEEEQDSEINASLKCCILADYVRVPAHKDYPGQYLPLAPIFYF